MTTQDFEKETTGLSLIISISITLLKRGGGQPLPLGEPFSERFTLGPGCLAMDDATSTCPMAKPKDLQRRSVLFQYTF